MMLKLYGLGPALYFKSQFNTFDCVVRHEVLKIICNIVLEKSFKNVSCLYEPCVYVLGIEV